VTSFRTMFLHPITALDRDACVGDRFLLRLTTGITAATIPATLGIVPEWTRRKLTISTGENRASHLLPQFFLLPLTGFRDILASA
jgi:hypothetical protein